MFNEVWVTFIGIHLTREPAAGAVLTVNKVSKLKTDIQQLVINFGNPCSHAQKVTNSRPRTWP